jgi:hypothetical protein
MQTCRVYDVMLTMRAMYLLPTKTKKQKTNIRANKCGFDAFQEE